MAVLLAVGLLGGGATGQGARHKDCSLQTPNGTYLFAYTAFRSWTASRCRSSSGRRALRRKRRDDRRQYIQHQRRHLAERDLHWHLHRQSGLDPQRILVDDGTGVTQHFELFIQRDGDAISFVQTDPGVVAAGIERRVDK